MPSRDIVSLVHSPTVRKSVDAGVEAITKRVAISAPLLHWHAVHFNTYWCTHKLRKGVSLERFHSDVLSVIHDRLVGELNRSAHREGIYFITELRGDELKRASKEMFPNAVWKDDVFPNATTDFPFEVAAQVDFEIGFALVSKSSGEYFGQLTDTERNFSVDQRDRAPASSSDLNLKPRLISAGVPVHSLRPTASCR